MMYTQNNPAGRLCTILKSAKSYKSQNQAAKLAWSEILEIDPNNIPFLLKQLGKVMELPEVIRQRISRYDDINQKVYLKWLPKVQRGFSNINLNGQFRSFTAPIDDAALDGLLFCSDLLSRRSPDKILDNTELNKIYEDTLKLRKKIIASNVDETTKKIMIQKFDEILSAIQEYKIDGSRPIEKVIESTIGEIITNKDLYEKATKSKFGDQFWKILSRVALVVTVTVGTIQIGESIVTLLPKNSKEKMVGEVLEPPQLPLTDSIIIKT